MTKAEESKYRRVQRVQDSARFVQFKGGNLWRSTPDTPERVPRTNGYERLSEDKFARLVYQLYPGITSAQLRDLYREVSLTSPDYTEYSHLIGFGDKVWNAQTLDWDEDGSLNYVYSSKVTPNNSTAPAKKFFLQLANGDQGLADDYVQAIAPLFMSRRPSGVIWFVGDGANGKSSLINAIYRIIGKHLGSLTVAGIEDGRGAPSLNGILGNVVRESSESRVEDTERYKAIGTHEPFEVRKYHTQEMVTVNTDFHTIFNANNIPVFSDKTKGARRRTLIVPFPAHFEDNPSFEDKTFTSEFLGGMVTLILEATQLIRQNGYKYQWSEATLKAKESYDSEVNSAEAYTQFLSESNVHGFSNYQMLKINYESWCSQNGFVPLGIMSLKRIVSNELGAHRHTVRLADGKVMNRYFFTSAPNDYQLTWLDNGYGMERIPEDHVKELLENEKLDPEW